MLEAYPNALFKPSAFVIILSAVGAVVAMLQKSEQEQRQRVKEMKCLYDIGRAAHESRSTSEFIARAADIIPHSMLRTEETSVKIVLRNDAYLSTDFHRYRTRITEKIAAGGEELGCITIYSYKENPYLNRKSHLARTLAERIGGAVRELELEEHLRCYYGQMEREVEARTRDLEQAQQKLIRSERLAAVGELASGVGHELRNPLNVMKNCIYLLKSSPARPDVELADTLGRLDRQVGISNRIITDLLDFTRIKKPSPSRLKIDNLLQETLSGIHVPEGITVSTNFNGSLYVTADPEQVKRAFCNIIINAFQAVGSEGEIFIDTTRTAGWVHIRFRDNGCGIPETELHQIFEPLFTTKAKGIGLGLAISKRLVEQNGGRIEVASSPGKGAEFTVALPE